MATYRTGNHWGVTIVATQAVHGLTSDGLPTLREEDQLVAVVVNGDHALAERICGLLNADEAQNPRHAAVDERGRRAVTDLRDQLADLEAAARRTP